MKKLFTLISVALLALTANADVKPAEELTVDDYCKFYIQDFEGYVTENIYFKQLQSNDIRGIKITRDTLNLVDDNAVEISSVVGQGRVYGTVEPENYKVIIPAQKTSSSYGRYIAAFYDELSMTFSNDVEIIFSEDLKTATVENMYIYGSDNTVWAKGSISYTRFGNVSLYTQILGELTGLSVAKAPVSIEVPAEETGETGTGTGTETGTGTGTGTSTGDLTGGTGGVQPPVQPTYIKKFELRKFDEGYAINLGINKSIYFTLDADNNVNIIGGNKFVDKSILGNSSKKGYQFWYVKSSSMTTSDELLLEKDKATYTVDAEGIITVEVPYQYYTKYTDETAKEAGTIKFVSDKVEEPEGISGTVVEPKGVKDGAFYDLQGRRVENPAKGFYIKNGKKLLLR